MLKLLIRSLLLCLMFLSLHPASALEWMPGLADAQKRAADEGKLVLTVFYGSEFTRNKNNLREEIMDSDAFRAYAREHFVPVELFEPRDRARHADFIWKYRALCLTYNIKMWPTVLVMTPEGIPTGGIIGNHREQVVKPGISYTINSDEELLNIICTALDNALHVAEKLREAEALPDGEQKLQALASVYYRLPPNLPARIRFAQHVADRDPNNKTGLRDEYLNMREMVEWGEIGRYGMDHATALRRMQEMIEHARPANLLTMLQQRYNSQSHHLHTEEDFRIFNQALADYAAELEKSAPDKAAELRRKHEELYSNDPAEGLRRLQERREAERHQKEQLRQEEEAAGKAQWKRRRSGSLLILPSP